MGVVGRLDQYASMLATEFDETTANGPRITGLGTYYASEFNENIVDIVRDGLVLNLDAGNLASYPTTGTTWTDLSGRGNTGTLNGSPVYSSSEVGGRFLFNGANWISFSTPIVLSTSGYTIELWMYLDTVQTLTDWNNLFRYDAAPIGVVSGGEYETGTYGNGAFLFSENGAVGNPIISGQARGVWAHYAFGCASLSPFYYENAVSMGTAGNHRNMNISISQLMRSQISNSRYLKGRQSVIRMYNRALSAAEIRQNYNALATRYDLAAPMSANIFPPYDLVYDEFGGTLFGAGQGRYMRQNTDKSVIVYNEIDEVSYSTIADFRDIVRTGLLLDFDAAIPASYTNPETIWRNLSGNSSAANLTSTSYTTDAGGGIYFSTSSSGAILNATLNFSGGGFTLETWIKHTGVVSSARIQRYMSINSSPTEGPVIRHNTASNGSLHAYIFDSGNVFRQIEVAGQIITGTYYHIVYTYDGTTFRLYKNNSEVGTLVATVTLPTLTTSQYFGAPFAEYFEGNMYAARYYNRALSAAEVSQNYNALKGRYGL
jgi:hypothetical protein